MKLKGATASEGHLWVYKVEEGNAYTVKNYINFKGINVGNKMLQPNFWPKGVACKIWKKKNIYYNNNKYNDRFNNRFTGKSRNY